MASVIDRIYSLTQASNYDESCQNGSITVIYFSSRSGSTFINSAVSSSTNNAAICLEPFSPLILSYAKNKYHWSAADLIKALLHLKNLGIAVFASISYHHFIIQARKSPCIEDLIAQCSYKYRLRRRDICSQIASRYRARTFNIWHNFTYSPHQQDAPYLSASKSDTTQLFEIGDAIAFVVGAEIGWDLYLAEQHLDGELYYEDIVEDPFQIYISLIALQELVTESDFLRSLHSGMGMTTRNPAADDLKEVIGYIGLYARYLGFTDNEATQKQKGCNTTSI